MPPKTRGGKSSRGSTATGGGRGRGSGAGATRSKARAPRIYVRNLPPKVLEKYRVGFTPLTEIETLRTKFKQFYPQLIAGTSLETKTAVVSSSVAVGNDDDNDRGINDKNEQIVIGEESKTNSTQNNEDRNVLNKNKSGIMDMDMSDSDTDNEIIAPTQDDLNDPRYSVDEVTLTYPHTLSTHTLELTFEITL